MKLDQNNKRRKRGFKSASSLLQKQIQKASETRGFAVSKLLTNWTEIIGTDLAKIAKPVKVNYGREGLGAGLVLLTNGANAPIVQAQSKQIIDRVNGVYGYNAISRVRITQIDPKAAAKVRSKAKKAYDKKIIDEYKKSILPGEMHQWRKTKEVNGIKDDSLNEALWLLGANIISKSSK